MTNLASRCSGSSSSSSLREERSSAYAPPELPSNGASALAGGLGSVVGATNLRFD